MPTATEIRPGQEAITPRWEPLRFHVEQSRLWNSPARFRVCHSGRRSGKTEIAKRFTVKQGCFAWWDNPRFVLAAPTRDQAKELFWEDLKALSPPGFISKISESNLTVKYYNSARISVVGMDKPYRIEGTPLDGIVLDEYGNMKPEVWTAHVRPALATPGRPPGWAWFIGVPEGRNHYYQLYKKARKPSNKSWDVFWWPSKDVMAAEEVEAMRGELDEAMFRQEAEGSWEMFEGRAYYNYEKSVHARQALEYDKTLPLVFCFDFNKSPGTASIWQEFPKPNDRDDVGTDGFMGCIGEVWIPQHSTTDKVCNVLIRDWKHHEGEVNCYGDATGGSGGSAKVAGSDWDIAENMLERVFKDIYFNIPSANPRERARVNSLNARCKTADGKIHLMVDPDKAPHMDEDLDGVRILEGSDGEIDKKSDKMLTHLSDGVGYWAHYEYPVKTGFTGQVLF